VLVDRASRDFLSCSFSILMGTDDRRNVRGIGRGFWLFVLDILNRYCTSYSGSDVSSQNGEFVKVFIIDLIGC